MLNPSTENKANKWHLVDSMTPDQLEQETMSAEASIAATRSYQVALLRRIDELQVPAGDGSRSLKEWVAGRLDVHPVTAGALAHMAKTERGVIEDRLSAGEVSFDRAAATTRLVNAGADADTVERSAGVAVHHVTRLTAMQQRLDESSETSAFEKRRIWLQPNLTNTLMTGTLTLAGSDAEVLLAALDERADELVDRLDPHRPRSEQLRADALLSLATDQQCGTATARRRPKVHVFIEAATAARTNGESGATTRHGLTVGPNTLEEILCVGSTQVTLVDTNGLTPLPTTGDRVHPRIRDFIFQRDGGCTADGCTSTHRLEIHHIQERSKGGDHHPNNLTVLCWFHHHVVVHRRGYRIDPNTSPGRRRFIRPITRPPPPQ